MRTKRSRQERAAEAALPKLREAAEAELIQGLPEDDWSHPMCLALSGERLAPVVMAAGLDAFAQKAWRAVVAGRQVIAECTPGDEENWVCLVYACLQLAEVDEEHNKAAARALALSTAQGAREVGVDHKLLDEVCGGPRRASPPGKAKRAPPHHGGPLVLVSQEMLDAVAVSVASATKSTKKKVKHTP